LYPLVKRFLSEKKKNKSNTKLQSVGFKFNVPSQQYETVLEANNSAINDFTLGLAITPLEII